jgi:hypothetical protein
MEDAPNDQMTWRKFVSTYAKTHTITYAQAMMDCSGPDGVWSKYKTDNNIVVKAAKAKVAPKEGVVAVPEKKKAVKAPKRRVVKVQAPPKGKKMGISYVDDEVDEDDATDEAENEDTESAAGA